MSIVSTLQSQHERVADLARALRSELDPERIAADGQTARSLLSNLVGVLKVHLSAEDNILYPKLMESTDPAVRETARRFVAEMGGLSKAVAAHVDEWPTTARVEADPQRFVLETRAILDALEKRVRNEENTLYPLIDD